MAGLGTQAPSLANAGTAVRDRRGDELDLAPLATLIDRIVAHWEPEQIWLFGSRARGDADDDSDWDLLVIVDDDVTDEALDDPVTGWNLQRGSGVRADVIACRAREFEQDRSTTNTLAYEAWTRGILLYER